MSATEPLTDDAVGSAMYHKNMCEGSLTGAIMCFLFVEEAQHDTQVFDGFIQLVWRVPTAGRWAKRFVLQTATPMQFLQAQPAKNVGQCFGS